jgi:hypothetical protein
MSLTQRAMLLTAPCVHCSDWEDLERSDKLFARKFLFNDPVLPRVRDELVKLNKKQATGARKCDV